MVARGHYLRRAGEQKVKIAGQLSRALCVSALALAPFPGTASALTVPVACTGTDGNEDSLIAAVDVASTTAGAHTVVLGQGVRAIPVVVHGRQAV